MYDDGGRLDTSTYANGVVADYNWRDDNLLADIGFSHPVGVAANRRIGTYTYAWDANKNKTKETITGQIPGYSFDTTLGTDPDGYDDEDRLTYFKRQSTTNPQTWDLSLVGDWNSWSNFGAAQNRTHGPAHEILTAGNTPNNAFSHDVKGNMTDIPSNILSPARKLFWDFDNQLTGVDTTGDPTPEVTYEYDVLHRRVARIEGSNSKVYIHSGNQIIADYNRGSAANTTPAFRYVWGDYIDEPILRQNGSTTILYYHRNQQYSTIALTNTSGEVVERYGYTAYGQMTVMNYLGNVHSWSDWSNRFLYTGREWDDTTKLFHFRARWYEPVAGRFVSRDPLGYVDGMGLYRGYFALFSSDSFGTCILKFGGEVEEWHHLLTFKYDKRFSAAGLDIDAAEYGWLLSKEDHRTGKQKIEPDWERSWDEFWSDYPEGGRKKPSKETILSHLEKMKQDPKFASILAKGRQATFRYPHGWFRRNPIDLPKTKAGKVAKILTIFGAILQCGAVAGAVCGDCDDELIKLEDSWKMIAYKGAKRQYCQELFDSMRSYLTCIGADGLPTDLAHRQAYLEVCNQLGD